MPPERRARRPRAAIPRALAVRALLAERPFYGKSVALFLVCHGSEPERRSPYGWFLRSAVDRPDEVDLVDLVALQRLQRRSCRQRQARTTPTGRRPRSHSRRGSCRADLHRRCAAALPATC